MSLPDLSFRSSKTIVRESPIHGRGPFATESIAQGEVVAIKGGYIVDSATWRSLERQLGPAEIQIADDLFIAPSSSGEREGAMIFTNHSCDPNICIEGQIVFVALRQIEAGEELTHDWATTDDDDYEMTCNCGASNCRGIVTGQDWRRPDLQRKYKGRFAWYLQRKIDEGPVRGAVTALLQAENRRDWELYRSLLDDNVEWTLLRAAPRVVKGAEEYMSTIRNFYEDNPLASFEIIHLLVDEIEGLAFAELDMSGRRSVSVFVVRAGRIAFEREYFGY